MPPSIPRYEYGKAKKSSGKDTKLPFSTGVKPLVVPVKPIGQLEKKITRVVINEIPFSDNVMTNQFVDSIDVEGSNVNEVANLFDYNAGFKGSEPTIIFSSEFSPLFENGSRNSIGEMLQLKHDSKIINIKTSLEVFKQLKGYKEEVIDKKKSDLETFILSQNVRLREISKSINETIAALDLSNYKEKLKDINNSLQEMGFQDFLKSNGYVNVSKFSNTKIWQQSLFEIKKALLTHSSKILGAQPPQINDEEQWAVYGIKTENPNSKRIRIWLNPYVSMPSVKELLLPNDNSVISKNLKNFTDLIFDLDRSQYLDLSVNAGVAVTNSTDPDIKNTTQLASSDLSDFANKVQSSNILDKYTDSGRDISIIANLVLKELMYSSALVNNFGDLKLTEYGFSPSTSGDNFKLWDHIIGRFSQDVRNIATNPTGQGNSLVSLSQRVDSSNQYQILTFEKNRIVQKEKGKNFTPGNAFYVESSLGTINITESDFSRLNQLISYTKNSIDTLDRVYKILGFSASDSTDNYAKSSIASKYTLEGMIKKLSIVSKVYNSCLNLALEADWSSWLNATSLDEVKTITYTTGFDKDKLKKLSVDDSTNVRLAAIICKTALEARKQNLSFLGMKNAKNLKSMLFMWLMNVVMFKVEKNQQAGNSALVLQDEINNILSTSSGETINLSSEITSAADEGRTYPFKVNTEFLVEKDAPNQSQKEFGTLLRNYYKTDSRNIQLSPDAGLWKEMVDILSDIYKEYSIYNSGKDGKGFTSYSGVSKTAYLYACFDLILRIVAAQTPEEIIAIYETTYEFIPQGLKTLLDLTGVEAWKEYGINAFKIKEKGLLISPVAQKTLSEYFDPKLLSDKSSTFYNMRLKNSITTLKEEENFLFSSIKMCMTFLKRLNIQLTTFKNVVSNNIGPYATAASGFFSTNELPDLNDLQRAALYNLSLSQEQSMMNRYIMDEYRDRLKLNSDSEAKLKRNPEFSKFENGFSDFLCVNDFETVSYDVLSSYFKSEQFQKVKSLNKKIISVGLLPKLVNSLRSSNKDSKLLDNLIRIRLYKIDRLRPFLVYKPQEYLFEMNRFPTRIISNWDLESIAADNANILRMPTKLFDFKKNNFVVHKDFSEAYPQEIYQDSLREEEQLLIYSNHIKSFLMEEYLRWMTDTRFEESRYHRYIPLSEQVSVITDQYKSYLDYLKVSPQATTPVQQPQTQPTSTTAKFTDPLSGQSYVIPIKNVNPALTTNSVATPQDSAQSKNTSNKKFELNMDETLSTYFYQNETVLSDDNFGLRRRATLPKKFDRVFNLLFDPDDFEVDALHQNVDLNEAIDSGLVYKLPNSEIYKHRDTTPQDVTFDEYFVTVEPYDYEE